MALKNFKNGKMNIYIDADDTILDSSIAVIDIINRRYSISPKKTIADLKEWNYTCIYSSMTAEEVREIYASTEFFEIVKANQDFLNFYDKFKDKFNFIVVSKGSERNLDLKEQWFKNNFPHMYFIGIEFSDEKEGKFDKSVVGMKNSIQIDDRADSLRGTNAECKILLKNMGEYAWNQPRTGDDFYIANSWKDIEEIMDFTLRFPDWCSSF